MGPTNRDYGFENGEKSKNPGPIWGRDLSEALHYKLWIILTRNSICYLIIDLRLYSLFNFLFLFNIQHRISYSSKQKPRLQLAELYFFFYFSLHHGTSTNIYYPYSLSPLQTWDLLRHYLNFTENTTFLSRLNWSRIKIFFDDIRSKDLSSMMICEIKRNLFIFWWKILPE